MKKQQKIQEYLKVLKKCPEEDVVWLVNQLQELGYKFYFPFFSKRVQND